jgi:16S rRNA (cytosine1402-N4)-methyltransferase
MRPHEPVLLQTALQFLSPRPGGLYIDATVGSAGHSREILEGSSPDGRLLGIDRDSQALQVAGEALAAFGPRVTLVHGNFARLGALARDHGFCPADGVLMDLGLSGMQLSAPERGFSFTLEGPLDMRMDQSSDVTAAELVNTLREDELADILYQFGEERMSRRIARAIVQARPLHTTTELAQLVERVVRHRGRTSPATRTFQGLRIAVNEELDALAQGLEEAVNVLAPGARLVVISFHSLEDRIVKRYFRQLADTVQGRPPLVRLLTRRPLTPSEEERQSNPRSRSAKLRALEKLASG